MQNQYIYTLTFLTKYKHFNKSDRVKLVLWAQTFPLSEMMWSCKCFLHASKILTLIYNQGNSIVIKKALILKIIHNIFTLGYIVVISITLLLLKRAEGLNHH